MSKFNTTHKIRENLSKAHKIGGAYLQCVNNHNAKFEYKGMKTVGLTYYSHITLCKHPKGGVDVIMSQFNTRKNII